MALKIAPQTNVDIDVPSIQEPSRKVEAYMIDIDNIARGLAEMFIKDPGRLDTLFFRARTELQKLRTKK